MKFSASMEWRADNAAVLRVHEGAEGRLGDPYVWC